MKMLAPLAVLMCAAGAFTATGPGAVNLTGFDVVIMGEVHDNPAHHANQADWVQRLSPGAVVFEMLTPELAHVAETWTGGPGLGNALQWEQRGWPDFLIYAPVFDAVPSGALIFGGDVTREALVMAMREGVVAGFGDAAPLFALDMPLPRLEQETRESEMADTHCGALPGELLPGMVNAQRLRDGALAKAVVAALAVSGPPIAVITGNGHGRTDWGLSVPLLAAMPDLKILSIGQLEDAPATPQPFDVITVSDAPLRGDPCDAFR